MTDIFRRLRHNFWEIYDPLHDRGFNDREIAEELGIHPGTLMRYKRMQINRDKETQKKKIEEVMKYMNNPGVSSNLKGWDKWKRSKT